ncbi:hypothetical protein GCM10010320_50140 [Streptomyces caelestis]|nr:hypothetical protein GCM10010320_50140 [Streptomyces caelestis]
MKSCASCSVAAGARAHRKRERLTSVSCTPARATVRYWSCIRPASQISLIPCQTWRLAWMVPIVEEWHLTFRLTGTPPFPPVVLSSDKRHF